MESIDLKNADLLDALRDEQYALSVDPELSHKDRVHLLQSWRAVYINRLHLAALHNVTEEVDIFSKLISTVDELLSGLNRDCPGISPIEEEGSLSGRSAALRGKMFHIFDEPNRPLEDYMREMAGCGVDFLVLCDEVKKGSMVRDEFEMQNLQPDVCAYLDVVDRMVEMDKKPADTCFTCKWCSGKLCRKSKETVSANDGCSAYKKKKKETMR